MSDFKNKVRNTDIRNLESPFAAARPERVGSCVMITHSPTIKKNQKPAREKVTPAPEGWMVPSLSAASHLTKVGLVACRATLQKNWTPHSIQDIRLQWGGETPFRRGSVYSQHFKTFFLRVTGPPPQPLFLGGWAGLSTFCFGSCQCAVISFSLFFFLGWRILNLITTKA